MMGSKTRSLLHWVLLIVVVILPIYGSKGSALRPSIVSPPKVEAAPLNSTTTDSRSIITKEDPIGSLQLSALPPTPVSTPRRFPLNPPSIHPSFTGPAPSATQSARNISFHGPAISPALVASPMNDGPTYGIPVAAPSKEISSHLYPVNHSHGKAIAPASTEVKKTSNTSLRFSPTMSPMPLEGKQPSNITDAPLSSPPSLSRSSPVINPLPHDMKPPLNAHAPLPSHTQPSSSPHEGTEPSVSPVRSHLHPSESSPAMSPAPNEVNSSSSASHPQPSRSSPAISPMPHEVKEPSNITDSPLPSSPPPHEVKEPSNSTHSPLPSHPLPLKSPPPLSPVPHEVMDPSINAHSPLVSHPKSSRLSPSTSPTPHVVKDPSNTTHSPLPSESSPVISPMPPEVTVPSNNTHTPLAPPPKLSGSAPEKSPTPPVVKEPSNVTHSSFPSHPFPSDSPPVISPSSHVVKDPSNVTHAPLPSDTKPSRISPIISPSPPEVNPSNVTHSPLPSHTPPTEFSPAPAPPHEVKYPSNITHAPVASRPMPSQSSPAMSPTPHEFKDPSNGTLSPLPSHPLPSQSSPVISRTPHEREPSNITHSPLPSLPHPSEHSPAVRPMPHGVKNQSNATEAPLASHRHPSVSSPLLSPMPHEVKNPSNITHASVPLHISHAPVASRPMPSQSSPAMSPTPHEFKDPSNGTLSPLPSHPLPAQSSPVISPTPHEREPSNITHSPLPSLPHHSEHSPAVSPTPHGVKNQSNATEGPLASHRHPSVSSPLLSPMPHKVKNPSNITHAPVPLHITHAPVASRPMPSQSSPAMSPTPHEFKDPSNGTLSPLPSHPLPSHSSPVMSPTPHEREPSNITHSPLPSLPHPSEHSPAVSPMPHGVKNQSNATEAPLASHRHPSVSSPLLSPMPHEVKNPSNITHAPVPLHHHPPSERIIQTPSVAPTISAPQPGANIRAGIPAFAPFSPSRPASHHPVISPTPSHKQRNGPSPDVQGPSISPIQAPSHPPSVVPKNNQRNHAPSPYHQAPSHSPIRAPFPSENRETAHAPSPSMIPSRHNRWPIHPPILPPGFSGKRRTPPPQPVWAFPPPPPNLDCKRLSCKDPLTYPPPGSLCVCISPIKVGLRLSIALYTFFPLVSELAQEIASGIFVKQSQVRVMGANAASEDSEKTVVLIDIVPLGRSFDMNTAFLIYERFWHKQVPIQASYFGDYDVLYVLYPGLPPSPPMAPGVSVDGGTLATGENARRMKPLGVDVAKRKEKLSGSLIAIIVLSSVVAIVISVGAAWLLLLKCRNRSSQPPSTLQLSLPRANPSGSGGATLGSGPSSKSASFASSIPAHTGSAKTFSLAEVERATDRFHDSRIIGEGGFGRVYLGTLEDGIMVAVKVLKRDDHQGGREFLAEVEMLSRLHHRNLVKLIGICTEENVRCLVYELIPNGSVESHLHGLDKETSPLDWNARMKIALGAARGLAYLHEDSSPRVIHRDFKSSNILLEHDFTPKVSDFGLARTALDEGNDHISTRVMGTFGYVAPEYAMTGHLLVKSDVYSYGVVLLELLTGRKPIDMSQPPGQENLVSWARPLLTSMDGLEKLIDPALSASISLDTVAKVAAIASMCVQPEVSHRPFMGEVVQALKLVCNESDEHRRSCSQDESSTKDSDIRISTGSGVEEERVLSESDIFCTSATFANDASGSFRRYSSSGPLKMGRSQMFWERVRGFSSGSMTERGAGHRYNEEHWP